MTLATTPLGRSPIAQWRTNSTAMPATRGSVPEHQPAAWFAGVVVAKNNATYPSTRVYYTEKRHSRINFNLGHRSPMASRLIPQLTQGGSLHTSHPRYRWTQ